VPAHCDDFISVKGVENGFGGILRFRITTSKVSKLCPGFDWILCRDRHAENYRQGKKHKEASSVRYLSHVFPHGAGPVAREDQTGVLIDSAFG